MWLIEYLSETELDLTSGLGLVIALIALIFALYQYRQGQRWTAIEFVSAEIKEFLENQDVRNTMIMLDYSLAPITVTNVSDGELRSERVMINDAMVITALIPRFQQDKMIGINEHIRRSFEVFFDYLAQFEHYINASGLLRYEDFQPYLSYWLKLLSAEDNQRKSPEYVRQLHIFLEAYEYQSVLRLIRRNEEYNRRQHRRQQRQGG